MFTSFSLRPLVVLNISINNPLDAIICHSFWHYHFAIVCNFLCVADHTCFRAMWRSKCGLNDITNLIHFSSFIQLRFIHFRFNHCFGSNWCFRPCNLWFKIKDTFNSCCCFTSQSLMFTWCLILCEIIHSLQRWVKLIFIFIAKVTHETGSKGLIHHVQVFLGEKIVVIVGGGVNPCGMALVCWLTLPALSAVIAWDTIMFWGFLVWSIEVSGAKRLVFFRYGFGSFVVGKPLVEIKLLNFVLMKLIVMFINRCFDNSLCLWSVCRLKYWAKSNCLWYFRRYNRINTNWLSLSKRLYPVLLWVIQVIKLLLLAINTPPFLGLPLVKVNIHEVSVAAWLLTRWFVLLLRDSFSIIKLR